MRQPLFLGEIGIQAVEKREKLRTKPKGQVICLSDLVRSFFVLHAMQRPEQTSGFPTRRFVFYDAVSIGVPLSEAPPFFMFMLKRQEEQPHRRICVVVLQGSFWRVFYGKKVISKLSQPWEQGTHQNHCYGAAGGCDHRCDKQWFVNLFQCHVAHG